jgi:hypothetical protein
MSASDIVKIRIHVSFNAQGADAHDEIEIPRAEWEAMSEKEQDEYMEPYIEVLLQNNVSSGYHEIDA